MLYDRFAKPLGIPPPTSRIELVSLARKGLPKRCASLFAKNLSLNNKEIGQLLDVSPRQMNRLGDEDLLSAAASGRLIDAAKVFAKTIEVFGDEKRASAWLREELPALGSKTPLSLLDTPEGAEIIMEELLAIEYGHFA